MSKKIITSAPGRICLFGEHQDYLGLPIVAMAVNLRFQIYFIPNSKKNFIIRTPDIQDSSPDELDIHATEGRYNHDYCWGIARVLLDEGFTFPGGGEATFHSSIPIRAGCSSSSAMSAAWMRLMIEIGEHPKKEEYINDPIKTAYLVYRGEKELFGGAGGMMDQYSCYAGGLIHVFPYENPESGIHYGVEKLKKSPEGFLLIDSGEPKDTQGILKSAGDRVRNAIKDMKSFYPEFDLREIELAFFDKIIQRPGAPASDSDTVKIVRDHIINRNICRQGLNMLRNDYDMTEFGQLLNDEHRILSHTLGVSTKLIDDIQQLTLQAGALGAKINGSGGGGALFCYAPWTAETVSKVLREKEIRFFPVEAAEGARLDAVQSLFEWVEDSLSRMSKTNYNIIKAPGGGLIKAWTKGVMFDETSRKQLINTAELPIIYKWVAAMPDVHAGIGATIGSVIPTANAIIPSAVGVDIGCGIMAVRTSLHASDLPNSISNLRLAIEKKNTAWPLTLRR